MSKFNRQDNNNKQLKVWEIVALISALIILAVPFLYISRTSTPPVSIIMEEPTFSGSNSCKSCHSETYEKWHGSDHEKAMAKADSTTVLGDFNNTTYTDPYNKITSTFYTKDGAYFVETEGPDGILAEFKITHTFGFYPLQQYLIPFPSGKLQCLNIAWNIEKKSWYRLPPYDVTGPNDWLHWTRGSQTWNAMCAECHSTTLEKKFDIESESYDTKWFEISVGCEACHGPSSQHIAWAEQLPLGRKKVKNFALTVATSNVDSDSQINTCAPCHSRRFQLNDNSHNQTPLLDKLVPSLLEAGLYHPDGQILDEVYVWGSFTQSKMYQNGVRCSDCHDPHTTKRLLQGNDLCTQCHRKEDFDSTTHHFHKKEYEGKPSEGYLCVKCHMPGQYYMGADYRPDHSLRIPRPDISKKLNTPNGCSAIGCHDAKPIDWVIEKYTLWYGLETKPHYGTIIAAGRAQSPKAEPQLIRLAADALYPTIVRATALSLLRAYPSEASRNSFVKALNAGEDLLRYTAIHNLPSLPPETVVKMVAPKLYDPVKAVRIEAAVTLASFPEHMLRGDDKATFTQALAEYRKAMEYNSDFAPQRYNLGNLSLALGEPEKAISYYQQAIQIDEFFFPAKVNLAMQYNAVGNNKDAEPLLREVVKQDPSQYQVAYSLGLLLAEMQQFEESVIYLGMAADGMPRHARARYNHALALLKLKQWQQGASALEKSVFIEPANQEYYLTLLNLYSRFNKLSEAHRLTQAILKIVPDHNAANDFMKMLSQPK